MIAKADFKNALSAAIPIAESILMSELARCVEAACGDASCLFFGDAIIGSEVGAKQGDPLGPPLFGIAAPHCADLPEALSKSLRGFGWYLDDGPNVGPAEKVLKSSKRCPSSGPRGRRLDW